MNISTLIQPIYIKKKKHVKCKYEQIDSHIDPEETRFSIYEFIYFFKKEQLKFNKYFRSGYICSQLQFFSLLISRQLPGLYPMMIPIYIM